MSPTANALYDKARESFLSQNPALDFDTNTIKWMLVKTAQAFSNAHQYVSDLTAGNIVARSDALTSKSVTAGVANAAAVTFVAPASGNSCYLILYKDAGGADTANQLIAYYTDGTGLPVGTNGGDVQVTPDTGTNKLFRL